MENLPDHFAQAAEATRRAGRRRGQRDGPRRFVRYGETGRHEGEVRVWIVAGIVRLAPAEVERRFGGFGYRGDEGRPGGCVAALLDLVPVAGGDMSAQVDRSGERTDMLSKKGCCLSDSRSGRDVLSKLLVNVD